MNNLDYVFVPISIDDNNFVTDWIDDLFDDSRCLCSGKYNEKVVGFIGERYAIANLDSIHPNEITFKMEDDYYTDLKERLEEILSDVSNDGIYFRFGMRNNLFCVAFYVKQDIIDK